MAYRASRRHYQNGRATDPLFATPKGLIEASKPDSFSSLDSLTLTALIVLARLLGVVDVAIPFDNDFAPFAIPPLASRNPAMLFQVSLLKRAPNGNLVAGMVIDLELAFT